MDHPLRLAVLAAAAALATLALAATPAAAKPKIATGSNCPSNWVNNSGAMQCFIQGEDESHAGVRHPHYVACAGGDVFCCVDNDAGDQNCVAQARGRPPTQADWTRAILGAHRNMLISLGRYDARPPTRVPPVKTPTKRAP